jgi:hypothetical protein
MSLLDRCLRHPLAVAALSTPILLAAACGGGGDDGQKAKLASDLVTCKNELSSLKEQLADAKAALKNAQEAAGQVVKLDPVEVKALAQATTAPKTGKEGNVSPEAVVKVVQMNSSGLRQCYDRALKRKPDLQFVNRVTAHFQVKNNGTATGVRFTPHTDSEMEQCMAQTFAKWKFPSFEGDPVAFEQPVNLVAK